MVVIMIPESPYKPDYTGRSDYSRGDYREEYSPRIPGREIRFYNKNQYDHFIIVDSDPNVDTFCELPNIEVVSSIDGKQMRVHFDMWIRWKNGREEFRRVENDHDKELFDQNPHLYPQLYALKLWADNENVNFEIYTKKRIHAKPKLLDNWKDIHHYLHDVTWLQEQGLDTQTLEYIKSQNGVNIRSIIDKFSQVDPTEIIRAIFWNLYQGLIFSDLDRNELTQKSTFWYR